MTNKIIERAQGGWSHRRRIIYGTLVFCAGIILFITLNGADTRIYETITTSAFYLAGLIISVYVLGATYQDVSSNKILTNTSIKEDSKSDGKEDI